MFQLSSTRSGKFRGGDQYDAIMQQSLCRIGPQRLSSHLITVPSSSNSLNHTTIKSDWLIYSYFVVHDSSHPFGQLCRNGPALAPVAELRLLRSLVRMWRFKCGRAICRRIWLFGKHAFSSVLARGKIRSPSEICPWTCSPPHHHSASTKGESPHPVRQG